jgi:hypothetical protein
MFRRSAEPAATVGFNSADTSDEAPRNCGLFLTGHSIGGWDIRSADSPPARSTRGEVTATSTARARSGCGLVRNTRIKSANSIYFVVSFDVQTSVKLVIAAELHAIRAVVRDGFTAQSSPVQPADPVVEPTASMRRPSGVSAMPKTTKAQSGWPHESEDAGRGAQTGPIVGITSPGEPPTCLDRRPSGTPRCDRRGHPGRLRA